MMSLMDEPNGVGVGLDFYELVRQGVTDMRCL